MGGLSSLFKLSVIMNMVDKVTPEAMKAGRSIDNLRGDMGELERASKSFERTGSSLRSTLSGLAVALGGFAAVKKGFSWLVGANADMEQYKNTLSVVLKSEEEAVKTLEWAQQFAAKTPFEIPQIVEATTRMSAYGINAQKTLGIVGDMASVMGKDLMQAVEAVADAQTGELERLKEFGITKGMIEDQAKLMGSNPINNKGQITDMQAFNDALFALMEDRFKGGMEMQSKSFKGMISNAQDFMGTLGRRLGAPLFDKLKEGLGSFLGVLDRLQDSGAIDRFIGNVHRAGAIVANEVAYAAGLVRTGFQAVQKVAAPIFSFLRDNWQSIRPFVQGIAIAIGAVATALGVMRTYTMVATVAMRLLSAAMLTNPIGWIILAVGLLIGWLIKLNGGIEGTKKVLLGWFDTLKTWWQSDGTQAWVSRAVSALRQFADQAMQAFGWIRQQAVTYWPVIRDAIVEAFAYIQTNVLPIVTRIFRDVSGMMARIWEVARPILTQLLATGVKAFRDIWDAVQPLAVTLGRLFQTVFPVVLAAVAAIYRAVTTYLPPVLAFVGEVFLAIYQAVVPIITNVVTSVVQAFNAVLTWALAIWPYVQQIIAGVFTFIQWVWAAIGPYVMAALEILKSIIINGFNFIAATIQFIWTTIKSIIMIAWAVISGIIKTALAIFTGDWQGAWDGVVGIVTGVWEGIKTFIGGFGSWLFESGKAIINTLVDGIKSVATAPVEAVKNIFGKVRELLPFSDAKTGPLSDLTYSGSKIPGTIAEGVDKGAGQLRAAAYRMMDGVELDRTYPVRFMAETVPTDIQELSVAASFTQTLKHQFTDLAGMIVSGFRRGAEWLQAAAGSLTFGIQPMPVPAIPGGGGVSGGFPSPAPFPGVPDTDDAPFPAAPSPGMRPNRVDVKEVFRESTTVRETIREKNGQKGPTIELHYHGGSERERRNFFDDLKRFIEQHRE
ncbi:hypothetical protein GE107_07325 [Cohnella sp. CFH 77786]|uniref:hypothetical protein n=1 Tax=Cohnella sp. CFH 77786 TaxID=2662265 RepID=UPI001C60CA5E|nr:hypothetical protein [Cohnella sp. CFH 77786]MBW5445870.1 hypothetical protein [Cohnella sp. CFH 77786]